MISNYTFILAVIATAMVNISGTVVTEAVTSKSYNLIQLMFMNDTRKSELVEMYNITFSRIFLSGSQGNLWMFASIFASAPFVILMCSAKKNNNIRFEIYRMGKKKYVMTKGIAALLVGGLVMCFGYGIFSLTLKCILPAGVKLSGVIITKRFIEMFLYGMSSVIFTFVLSGLMRNKYLVLCIPFMANYLLKGIMEKPGLSESTISQVANPTALSYIFSYEKTQMEKVICFWSLIFIFGFIFYFISIDRRCDCGE